MLRKLSRGQRRLVLSSVAGCPGDWASLPHPEADAVLPICSVFPKHRPQVVQASVHLPVSGGNKFLSLELHICPSWRWSLAHSVTGAVIPVTGMGCAGSADWLQCEQPPAGLVRAGRSWKCCVWREGASGALSRSCQRGFLFPRRLELPSQSLSCEAVSSSGTAGSCSPSAGRQQQRWTQRWQLWQFPGLC